MSSDWAILENERHDMSRKSIRIVGHSILAFSVLALSVFTLAFVFEEGRAQQNPVSAVADVTYAAQGWSVADRDIFYTTSQGSHIMPYVWFKALRRVDVDEPFVADMLQRYGYLPNDVSVSNPEGLPVGFVIDGDPASGQMGLTCAACHTGQMEYTLEGSTHALRIDGAPSNADAQQFLVDLLAAADATLTQSDRFDKFSKAVLAEDHTTANAAETKEAFEKWVAQFQEFMDKSLPATPLWGPGRLDAFGMIFNRVVARDLGVPGNFKIADAPVSYPFLWDASRQDRTQWNGGVPNGLYIQALARNSGEVLGVFADFAPHRKVRPTRITPAIIDYSSSSVDLAGLQTLEEKIVALQAPPWPREIFALDDSLATLGKPLFEDHCSSCHAKQDSHLPGRWITPVLAVGTDPKMVLNSVRMADPGLLEGALMPPPAILRRIANPARAADILAAAIAGSQIEEVLHLPGQSPAELRENGLARALKKDFAELFPGENLETLFGRPLSLGAKLDAIRKINAFISARLSNMFNPPVVAGPAYESRVLSGIWATAPYLHNGSVPNLWELLKPAGDRTKSFMVGSRVFDPKNVGYDTEQSPFKNGSFVVDPANANGNGNGGHEYGTTLTEEERWAIVEYLKTL